ncbi:hypothetical protein J7K60_05280 [Candidatus Bipolaricaulota bacterium]|nr:hypothetical protein [Candidatus Bipolaricaulota bacterium]HHR85602.1 hypothetical protein [Candidatus Acetothermia bacterium]
MKLTSILILFILAASCVTYAYPHQLLLDLPIAESIGDSELTTCRLDLSLSGGISLDIGRAITDRLDIWMSTSPSDLFLLRARALLVDHLGPLSMSLDLSRDGFTLLSGFFLGPVEIDWGRIFGPSTKRWATITTSPNQFYSVLLGIEYETYYSLFAALRLFPRRGVWAFSLYYRGGQWGALIGAAL